SVQRQEQATVGELDDVAGARAADDVRAEPRVADRARVHGPRLAPGAAAVAGTADPVAGLALEAFGAAGPRAADHLGGAAAQGGRVEEATHARVHQDLAVGELRERAVPVALRVAPGPNHRARGRVPAAAAVARAHEARLPAVAVAFAALLVVAEQHLAV